jgi:allophanate hydrolase
LYGIPFAIKDNIDLAGLPTTAACPAYAYTPPNPPRWCNA